MIVIEPIGGLANRMRVIVSAINLKKIINFDLHCVWVENEELNAPFISLFEEIDGLIFVPKQKKYNYLKSSNKKNFIKKTIVAGINKYYGFNYCLKQSDFTESLNIIDIIKHNKRVYIRTCEEFYSYNNEDFNIFKPTKQIMHEIHKNCIKFNNNTIGIHIRRTDNALSIQHSPFEIFIKKIEEEIRENEEVNFFLSTDDISVESLLIDKYNPKIFATKNKVQNRNTEDGVKAAVVDMFSLSSTTKIYGSYWSSFSDIAARIGNIDCITLKI